VKKIENSTLQIVLGDFGVAKDITHTNAKTQTGNKFFMGESIKIYNLILLISFFHSYLTPEINKNEKYDGKKADYWSLGLLCLYFTSLI